MTNVEIRKKAMILQPMNGLTDEEIEKTRNKLIKLLERLGYKIEREINVHEESKTVAEFNLKEARLPKSDGEDV